MIVDIYHQTTKLGALRPYELPDPNETIQAMRDRISKVLVDLNRQNLTCQESLERCDDCQVFCRFRPV
jgi:hypothetical protein